MRDFARLSIKTTPTLPTMKSIAVCLFALLLTGCGTVVRGTKQTVTISSNPSNAEVVLSNGMKGTTPVAFSLARKEAVQISISKEGYQTYRQNFYPRTSTEGAVVDAGNILVGGIVGWGIDAATGAYKDVVPDGSLFVELQKEEPDAKPVAATSPLNEKQEKEMKEKFLEKGIDAQVVEWGHPYKVDAAITGLSKNSYLGVRVKSKDKTGTEVFSSHVCVIDSDGKITDIRNTSYYGQGSLDAPFDGKLKTVKVTLN